MTTEGNNWVKDAIQNYVMESNGRVMNEIVAIDSVNTTSLKDKCIDNEFK